MNWKAILFGICALLVVLIIAPNASANTCLKPDGEPRSGDDGNVYIKVKNVCKEPVPLEYEVRHYNFGVQGTPIGSGDKGTVVIDPESSHEICSPKPKTPGKYCFFFIIKSFDVLQGDFFTKWLNNIEVEKNNFAATSGTFEVGGSGLVSNDIVLSVVDVPDWHISLSNYYVSAASFPASIFYTISGPDYPLDEDVVLTVDGYDAVTGDWVGHAQFTIPATRAIPYPANGEGASADDTDASGAQVRDGLDEEPIPTEPPKGVPPSPVLSYSTEANSGLIAGQAMLIAWDENGLSSSVENVTFEFLGHDGWELIAEEDLESQEHLGIAIALWDTTDLESGEYLVQATMVGTDGQVGTAERVLNVTKRPTAEMEAFFLGETVTFDGSGSYDPDGSIADWEWNMGDGTVLHGPTVTHAYKGNRPSYPVSLTVTDYDGHQETMLCTAMLFKAQLACAATCGCASMDIKTNNNAGQNFPGYVGGGTWLGPSTPAWTPGGNNGNDFSMRFEVIATLKPGSTPSLCKRQQWVKRTSNSGGKTKHKTVNGQSFPLSGGAYGADGPCPGLVQENPGGTPPSLSWIDAPGFGGVTAGGAAASGFTYNAKFFAMVSGPTGTCKCTWEVNMKMDKTGAITTPPEVKNKKCS